MKQSKETPKLMEALMPTKVMRRKKSQAWVVLELSVHSNE